MGVPISTKNFEIKMKLILGTPWLQCVSLWRCRCLWALTTYFSACLFIIFFVDFSYFFLVSSFHPSPSASHLFFTVFTFRLLHVFLFLLTSINREKEARFSYSLAWRFFSFWSSSAVDRQEVKKKFLYNFECILFIDLSSSAVVLNFLSATSAINLFGAWAK